MPSGDGEEDGVEAQRTNELVSLVWTKARTEPVRKSGTEVSPAVVPRPLSYRCLKSLDVPFAPRHVNQLAFDIREPRARACERGEDRKTGQEQLVVDGWLCSRCAGT